MITVRMIATWRSDHMQLRGDTLPRSRFVKFYSEGPSPGLPWWVLMNGEDKFVECDGVGKWKSKFKAQEAADRMNDALHEM